ncbi:DUF6074 family protein [Aminobacter ciceronei]|jgi:hypothetical protein|uniref:Uncharacterized protein n=1 Tax=Aminobacter ciceronei TaxID=150723 RepID=A0ABR6C6G2_9HYPH|nr:DUF6074 family protein [Aminobacter ciceronei]MBA8906818.1 hypothetical protein [Aminobacter ciceronei]MBA9020597.1 hypothetical protein [Aminobacter ciceronei]
MTRLASATDRGAAIVPFPARYRVGKIRRVADVLGDRRGKSADQYWQQIVDGMASQMQKSGLATPVIEQELREFFGAVQVELCRRLHVEGGGGAA